MTKLYSQYGVRGLFTGLVPRVIKVAPACAIMIATFEYGKIAFNRLANFPYPSPSNVVDTATESNAALANSTVRSKETNKGLIRDITVSAKHSEVL